MPCFRPLRAYRTGDGQIVFKSRGFDEFLDLPCGQCRGCRLKRSREWALRCVHECQYHDDSCFLTLTYDDEHLPFGGSLVKWHFQDFMKRLRARVAPLRLKYFMCGEYGSVSDRPHYHACLFGFDFPDKVKFSERGGYPVFTSGLLDDLWKFGLHEIGTVTWESAAYVADYMQLKNGKVGWESYMKYVPALDMFFEAQHEYIHMSNGIGESWCEDFLDEVADDAIPVRGALVGAPRYYLDKLESRDLVAFEDVKGKRKEFAYDNFSENSASRLRAKERVAESKARLFAKEEV